jgi:hypothetical protein
VSKKNTFEDLANQLSSNDRAKMSEKLGDIVTANEPDNNKKTKKASTNRDKPIVSPLDIRQAFDSFPFFIKLIIRLKMFFGKKSLEELCIEQKLILIKDFLRSSGDWINVYKEEPSIHFSSTLSNLYTSIINKRDLFVQVWNNPKALQSFINNMLVDARIIPIAKVDVYDFVDLNNLLQTFTQNPDADAIKRTVIKAIKSWLDSLPAQGFHSISTQISLLYALNHFFHFPFAETLKHMGVPFNGQAYPVASKFAPKPSASYINELSSLFAILSHISAQPLIPSHIVKVFFSSYYLHVEKIDINIVDDHISSAMQNYNALLSQFSKFCTEIPYLDILRYLKHDPFYQIPTIDTRVDIKDAFSHATRSVINSDIDNVMIKIRLAYVEQTISKLFEGIDLVQLTYYKEPLKRHWPSQIGYFMYVRSITLSYNFLCKWFKQTTVPLLSYITSHVVPNVPVIKSKINEYILTFQNIEERLLRIDSSLAPDKPQGKLWAEIISSQYIEHERYTELSYFFETINQASDFILNELIENLTSFEEFITLKIVSTSIESIRTKIATITPQIDREKSLRNLLALRTDTIKIFISLIKETIANEKSAV